MKLFSTVKYAFSLLLLTSCGLFERAVPAVEEKPLATVYDDQLYPEDIVSILPQGISPADSAVITKNYIQTWVEEKLLLNKAYEAIDPTDFNIEQKIEKFKDQLIIYEFENKFLNQNLNKKVSKEEIEAYYQENKANFDIQQPIVKGYYLKVKNTPETVNEAKKLIKKASPGSIEDLKNFSYESAESYNMNDSTWYLVTDFSSNTPLEETSNLNWILKSQKFIEKKDSSYTYFLKINDYQDHGSVPLELVEEQIREIIISKRRMELKSAMSRELYDKAKENEEIIIY